MVSSNRSLLRSWLLLFLSDNSWLAVLPQSFDITLEGNDPYLAMTLLISLHEARYIQVLTQKKYQLITMLQVMSDLTSINLIILFQRVFGKTVSEGYFSSKDQVARNVWEFFHDTRPCQGIQLMPEELNQKPE